MTISQNPLPSEETQKATKMSTTKMIMSNLKANQMELLLVGLSVSVGLWFKYSSEKSTKISILAGVGSFALGWVGLRINNHLKANKENNRGVVEHK